MTVPSGVTFYLEVNSVSLDTYAWRCLSYGAMFSGPEVRGSDLVLPSAVGARAYPRITAATVKSFSLHVFGNKAQDGTSISNALEGLATHRAYLLTNLGLGLTTGNGTVTATWHRGSLGNKTGPVTVLAIADWENINGREATCRIDLSIPAGELA